MLGPRKRRWWESAIYFVGILALVTSGLLIAGLIGRGIADYRLARHCGGVCETVIEE